MADDPASTTQAGPSADELLGHNRDFSREHIDRALAEFREEWPQVCRQLAITPQMIQRLDSSVLMATVLIRMWRAFGEMDLAVKRLDAQVLQLIKRTAPIVPFKGPLP